MNTGPDIPDEFRESVFRDYLYIVTAQALIGAQYVERVLNAICLILNADGIRFSVDDFMSGDSARTRQTLHTIAKQLQKADLFEQSFTERLFHFARRRNRLVHGLFADSFKSRDEINMNSRIAQEYVKECQWVAQEAQQLVEAGFGIYRVLGDIPRVSNSDNLPLNELRSGFDEFYGPGLACVARELRPHFISADTARAINRPRWLSGLSLTDFAG